MQTKLREEIDTDLAEKYVSVSDYITEQNRYGISCGECAKTLFADEETAESISRAIERGLDNPFRCNDCQQEYEELLTKTVKGVTVGSVLG